jgi:hypothetical protein
MRSALSIALVALLMASACTSVQTKVTGRVRIEPAQTDVAPAEYHYEALESHDVTGLAVLCWFTALFYGGACWAYLAVPFGGQEIQALSSAHRDVAGLGTCASLVDASVGGGGWDRRERMVKITDADGRVLRRAKVAQMCDGASAPQRSRATDPEDSEGGSWMKSTE